MRVRGLLFFLASVVATPALAESSLSLRPLEQQLAWIAAENPGNVGIAAIDLNTGEMVSLHGDKAFPMASTVKVAIAALYLRQVEMGRRTLDQRIGAVTAAELMRRMLVHSDNVATDRLLDNLGGPAHVQQWFDQHQLKGLRIDRTIAQLLAARRDLYDVRDSSTPKAMVDLLRRLDRAEIIGRDSRDYLFRLMADCQTGRNRIRAGVPFGTRVEHKTGTLTGLTDDVGYITMPDGRRVAVAIFARYGANRPATIARAARTIYDNFANRSRSSLATTISATPATASTIDELAPLPAATGASL